MFTEPLPNDLNENGKVDVQDTILLLRIAVGLLQPTEAQKVMGDVNGDGMLDIPDAIQVLRKAVGLP